MRKSIFVITGIALMVLMLAHFQTSPAVRAQTTPTPELTPRAFLPLVMRNYPPQFCSPPTLLEPENGAQLDTLAPLFRWNTGDDPDAVRFELQVAQDEQFGNIIFTLITFYLAQEEERLPFNLYPSTTYYWRARLVCNTGDGEQPGPWTEAWSFVSAPPGGEILPAPSLMHPVNETVQSPVTFTWQAVTGAVEYGLYFRQAGAGGYIHVATASTQETLSLASGDYEWWVRARNDYAWGEASEVATFTVTGSTAAGGCGKQPGLRCDCTGCVRR